MDQQPDMTEHDIDELTEPKTLQPPAPGWVLKTVQIEKGGKRLRAWWERRRPPDLSLAGARSERSDLGPPRGRS
jgi:hypothetical protein